MVSTGQHFQRALITLALIGFVAISGGCSTYRGPVTTDPHRALPRSALDEKVATLKYGDSIEIRFTSGATAERQYDAVRDAELLTFTGGGGARTRYSDPLDSISAIRSRELQVTRTVLASAAVAGGVLLVASLVALANGTEIAP